MKEFPDQREDDITFARLFSEWGIQTRMSRLMGVSAETLRRMLDPDNAKHPSDLHRARRLVFAGYEESAATGDAVWAELEEARARVLGTRRPERVKFPSRTAHAVIDLELNTEDLDAVPVTKRRALIRKLIRELESYEAGMMLDDLEDSRDGDEPERATRREVTTPRPAPVAARS